MSIDRHRQFSYRIRSVPVTLCLLSLLCGILARPVVAVEFPGPEPGTASARLAPDDRLTMENAALSATWSVVEGQFRLERLEDRISNQEISLVPSEAFAILLSDGRRLSSSDFRISGEPTLTRLEPNRTHQPGSEPESGWRATVKLTSDDLGQITWTATLRDRSNYLRTRLSLAPTARSAPLSGAAVLIVDGLPAEVAGTVSGSPVVAGNLFFGCEHPLAENRVADGRVECISRYRRNPGNSSVWTRSAAFGVAPPDQMRRAFLYYAERERARPYRLFLHYNSWWDIAWPGRRMDESQCLAVMECLERELFQRRGVPLDSYVFDDGWDNPRSLWQFHDGFPQGFEPHQNAAADQDSSIGVWLSPWGGYGQAKADRLAYGETQGFETNSRGFSLAGPTYYARFSAACKGMIDRYGANYFKFDGIGQGLGLPGARDEFAADVEALLTLTRELRQKRPDIYLSITTGTWPSPYWLWYGDSVWRNGHDLGFHGAGSKRQQSITYRDMFVRRAIVDRAPLYPLNSLMIVSVCQAQLGTAAEMVDDVDDLPDEIRMAFAGGTQLLELYVTPSRMTPEGWDVLAECTRWSRENADALVDAHWVGGDPGEAQPYGYAAWSPRKGILTLRNPADVPQSMRLSLAEAFESPRSGSRYLISTPWSDDPDLPDRLADDEPHEFKLAPLEILLIEAVPEDEGCSPTSQR